MSSRRKSRPFRRLDSVSGEPMNRNLSVTDSVFEEGPYDTPLPTPEGRDVLLKFDKLNQSHFVKVLAVMF